MKIALIILCALLASVSVEAADISVTLISEETGPVDHLFRIENLNHVSGSTSSALVNLSYSVQNETSRLEGNSSHIINKFTTNTPGHNLTGNISVCVNISVNETDSNLDNNQFCRNIPPLINETEDSEEENLEETPINSSDCAGLQITGVPSSIASGTQIVYQFEPWQSGDEVSYWVEDARGNVIKQEITTTSSSARKYTPKTAEGEKGIIIFARRTRESCEESLTSAAVIVVGEEADDEELENSLELSSHPDSAMFGEQIIIGVTLTKEKTKKENVVVSLLKEHEEITRSKFQLRTKGIYEFEIPLMIPEDAPCDISDGEYDILVSALDKEIKVPLQLDHEDCVTQEEFIFPITSLYTRNKKFAESISLRGKSLFPVGAKLYQMIGDYQLQEDFVINISPVPGNSSYVLLTPEGNVWTGKEINLSFPVEKETQSPQKLSTANTANISGTFTRESSNESLITGQVTKERKNTDKGINIIVYLSIVPVLLAAWFILKSLRKPKNHKLTEYL